MPPRMKSSRDEGSRGTTSSDSSSGSRSPAEINRQVEVKTDQGISLNQPLLRNATSSGIPTFLWITGVPVIDRRNKVLVSVGTLGQKNNNRLVSKGSRYYSTTPLCLRGDIPATSPSSRERAEPKQSVRGPRGAREVPSGAFAKPGLLGGLCVSPWVIEEETERAQRALSQQEAFSKGNLTSHATSGRKPQRFNTSQRRREYTCALAAKREAMISRDAVEMVAAELEKERREVASEVQEGIDAFEGNLKIILQQKWTLI